MISDKDNYMTILIKMTYWTRDKAKAVILNYIITYYLNFYNKHILL